MPDGPPPAWTAPLDAWVAAHPLWATLAIGAASAVLLLVFRDTLLSLVAGIQLTGNDLIRVGDWIGVPQFNADGDVVDIALNTVKVQKWDRTFTVIPTHRFLEHSFKNWRGMQASGGRRIKRSTGLVVRSFGSKISRTMPWRTRSR
jgi:miniconductance mechanosensitive channel